VGRPPSTSHAQLERAAFELFSRNGFDATTVDDITAAVQIGRRTFFRYYASKADVVWGDFAGGLARMRDLLAATPNSTPMLEALRAAVIDFNTIPPEDIAWHRQRMSLILGEPTLYAGSTLKFREWREVVAEFAARRLRVRPIGLVPVLVGYSALGGSLAAYEQWLARPGSDLRELLDEAWDALAVGFEPKVPLRAVRGGRNG
jgi:mycofactocin system transcriptional regulator